MQLRSPQEPAGTSGNQQEPAGTSRNQQEPPSRLPLFPGCLGDTQFSFRFRQSVGRRALRLTEDIYNRDAPVSLQVRPPRTTSSAGLLSRCPAVSAEGGVPFLWLRLLQTSEGRLCEERILPESGSHLSPAVPSCPQLLTRLSPSQSLVLVSRFPYVHLFHSLLQIVAPEFFEKLEPCLENGDVLVLPASNQQQRV